MIHTEFNPFFTIITSTLNAESTISRCVESVKNQTFKSYEHIVVDGASTDNTVTYIKSQSEHFSVVISEPDNGIYDAWNKALEYRRGQWILFLGADDALADNEVLKDVHDFIVNIEKYYRIVYGNVIQLLPNSFNYLRTVVQPIESIGKNWVGSILVIPPHPATFHHTSLFENYGKFDPTYKVVGDAKLLISVLAQEKPIHYNRVINKHTLGGISSELGVDSFHETVRLMSELKINVPLYRKLIGFFRAYSKLFVRILIGEKNTNCLLSFVRRFSL
ncbi:glycosyltransferase family 2 protein [Planktothricoides raciborskii]|uniref:Glycosyltransferase family 2 protein n=1 Tax=Planktothricoides raciborskii GIHE-MW2 TaxID=2792601 RepID=A0AAU8J8M8_9CYAN